VLLAHIRRARAGADAKGDLDGYTAALSSTKDGMSIPLRLSRSALVPAAILDVPSSGLDSGRTTPDSRLRVHPAVAGDS